MRKSRIGTALPEKIAIGKPPTPSTIASSPATIATSNTASSTPTRSNTRSTDRQRRPRSQEGYHGCPSLSSSKILETMIVPTTMEDLHDSSLLPIKKNLMGVMFLANMASASRLACTEDASTKEERDDAASEQRRGGSCARITVVTPDSTRRVGDENLVSCLQSYPSFDDEDYYYPSSEDESSIASMEDTTMGNKSLYAQPTPLRPPRCDAHRIGHTPAIQEVDEESLEELEKEEANEIEHENHVETPSMTIENGKNRLDHLVWLRWILLFAVVAILATVAAMLTSMYGDDASGASAAASSASSKVSPSLPPKKAAEESVHTMMNPGIYNDDQEYDSKDDRNKNVFITNPDKSQNESVIDTEENSNNGGGMTNNDSEVESSSSKAPSIGCRDQFDSGTFPCLTSNVIDDLGTGDQASTSYDFILTSNGGAWEGINSTDITDISWPLQSEDMIGVEEEEEGGGGIKIEVLSTLDPSSEWQNVLETTMRDWEESGAVEFTSSSPVTIEHELSSSKSPIDDILCQPIPGKIKICEGNYGETEWKGITLVVLEENKIVASSIRLNNFYRTSNDAVGQYEWARYNMCHQMGHALGLVDADDGSCMSGTDINLPTETFQSPNQSSFDLLLRKYGHLGQRYLRGHKGRESPFRPKLRRHDDRK